MKSLDQIHKIMEKIYDEEKGLSVEERVKRTREEAERFLKDRSINLKRVSPKTGRHVLR